MHDSKDHPSDRDDESREPQTGGPADAGPADSRTRRFTRETFPDDVRTPAPDPAKTATDSQEQEVFSFRRVKTQSPYRPLLKILIVVLLIFLALFIYQMVRSHRNTQVLKKAGESSPQPDRDSGFLAALENRTAKPQPEEQPRAFLFPDNAFQGEALLPSGEQTVQFGAREDAWMAALADALNIRVRILAGIKTASRDTVINESCSGNFRGFRVSSLFVRQDGRALRDEITVTTPSRGIFRVSKQLLESVSRTDPDQVRKDLEAAGIRVIPLPAEGDGLFRLQLRIVPVQEGKAVEPLSISAKGVGRVALGSEVTELESLLPPGYMIIKRRIMVENEFVFIYKVEDQGKTPLFYIYEQDGLIWGIEIVDPRFKTDRGLGIGSTLGGMRIFYTGVGIVAVPGKITYLQADVEELKTVKFVLADDRRFDFGAGRFPLDARIGSILIGNSPVLSP